MDREEILIELRETNIDKWCEEAKRELYYFIKERKDMFRNLLIEHFQKLLTTITNNAPEIENAFVHISYLRAGILDSTYDWYMEAQDTSGALDESDRGFSFSMREFFEPLESLDKRIKTLFSQYVGTVTECDAEKIKLQVFAFFVPFFNMLGCYAFQNIMEDALYQEFNKADVFQITFGEYKGECSFLHVNNTLVEKKDEFLQRLYSPIEEKGFTNPEFYYVDFRNFRFQDECIMYKGFLYGNFTKASFVNQQIIGCNLVGANFTKTTIEDCNFYYDICIDADFTDAVIEMTEIAGCHFQDGAIDKEHITPGIGAVCFQGAVIRNTQFMNCYLAGCRFDQCTLDTVNFEDSDLTGAVFRKLDRDKIELSKEQMEQVTFI